MEIENSKNQNKLCIDGRSAAEFNSQGIVAQELIDQLVCADQEAEQSEIQENQNTVLLSHPEQVFSGQMPRLDTNRRIGSTFMYNTWERNFVEEAHITTFHRFRPIDRLQSIPACATLTTLLPPKRQLPRSIGQDTDHRFVTPSEQDKRLLNDDYGVNPQQIWVVRPAIRRYASLIKDFSPTSEGWILFLSDNSHPMDIKKLTGVIAARFPNIPQKVLDAHDERNFRPSQWIKTLENTRLVLYLTAAPFEWPYPALEAFFFEVPCIFLDAHHALSEMVESPILRLSKFLIEQPSHEALKEAVRHEKENLEARGTWAPLSFANQYKDLYKQMESPTE